MIPRWIHKQVSPLLPFLTLLSTIFSLCAIELVLWFANPASTLGKNGIIDGKMYTWGIEILNNKLGYREKEFITPKPLNTYRVMVLGDSLSRLKSLFPRNGGSFATGPQ
ncbi:MAG: hypothetical protein SGJ02_12305 [bacterium]|nr:hypothetical protein [bacterium]